MRYAVTRRQVRRHHQHPAAVPTPAQRGFQPAFLDQTSGRIYVSLTTEGEPAPIHLPDCLPDHLVQAWDQGGRVVTLRPRVVHGYVYDGRFYDRGEAQCMLGGTGNTN